MPQTRSVRAREGLRVPMEGAPRRYITAAEPVTVAHTPYYRRLLADGDLVEEAPAAAPAPAASKKPKREEG